MTGAYVIVRCRDAGVHAGQLVEIEGRMALLKRARRLWYWRVAGERDYLSGVAVDGVHPTSRIGCEVPRLLLTETCEVMLVSEAAAQTIQEAPDAQPI